MLLAPEPGVAPSIFAERLWVRTILIMLSFYKIMPLHCGNWAGNAKRIRPEKRAGRLRVPCIATMELA